MIPGIRGAPPACPFAPRCAVGGRREKTDKYTVLGRAQPPAHRLRTAWAGLVLCSSLLLAACGGGGGDSDGESASGDGSQAVAAMPASREQAANPGSSAGQDHESAVWANQRLAKHQRICGVEFLAEFPRNALGKVLKRVLRERFGKPT